MRIKLRAKLPEQTIKQLEEISGALGCPDIDHTLVAIINAFYANLLHLKRKQENGEEQTRVIGEQDSNRANWYGTPE